MLSLQSYGNAALKLHENGYIPIPIKPLTKKPSIRDWSNLKNDYDLIDKLSLKHPNDGVGILLHDVIVFDIDIVDDKQSLLIRNIIIRELGDTIERIGKFPKRALFYRRSGDEFRKKSTQIFNLEKGKAQLEVLASGTQCIIFGTHPETKQSYQWIDESPLEVHSEDLPRVNLKQVKNIITQSETLLQNHVVQKQVNISAIKTSINEHKKEEGIKDIPLVRSALSYIDPEDYNTWIKIGHALKKTFKGDGFEIFDDWSKYKIDGSECLNYHSKEFNRKKWDTFDPENIDKRYIFKLASQNDWQGGGIFEIESNTHTSVAKYLKSNLN